MKGQRCVLDASGITPYRCFLGAVGQAGRPSALPPFISQLYNAMCLPTVSCYSLLPHFSHSSEHPSAGECGGVVPLAPRLWLLAVGYRLHHTGVDLRAI